MCTCIHIHMCVYTTMCIYIEILCIYTYMFIHTCCVYIYIYMYIYIYIYTCIHTYVHIYIYIYIYIYIHVTCIDRPAPWRRSGPSSIGWASTRRLAPWRWSSTRLYHVVAHDITFVLYHIV